MIKFGQVYKCSFNKSDMRMVNGEWFYVLVGCIYDKCSPKHVPYDKIMLIIIKDNNTRFIGTVFDEAIEVKDINKISSSEETRLFDKLEYHLVPHYQVNFTSL